MTNGLPTIQDWSRMAARMVGGQKRVYRYRSGETANFPQRDFWLAIVCDRA